MAKGQKSSASSATRKKHALKASGGAKQELPLPKEKKKEKGKGKNKESRVKVYIPPSKPAPVRPDPLDSLGIAKKLPPELLIVLRRLGKKDSVTKRKALEELYSDWVDKLLSGNDHDGTLEVTLETSLPVWLHHLPSLLLSASRRIRLLAATIHTSLLRIAAIHAQIVYFIQEAGDATQIEAILGSWCMATEDVERTVATPAKSSWDLVFRSPTTLGAGIDVDEGSLKLLFAFIKRALLDPMAVYTDLNPIQPAFVPTLPAHASPRNKGGSKRPSMPVIVDEDALPRRPEEEEESDSDRKGRLRVGALGVLRWMIEKEDVPIFEQLSDLLKSPLLWTGLYYGPNPPFCSADTFSGFVGDGQPIVRKASWKLLRSLLTTRRSQVEDLLLSVLSSAILRSAWVEPDSGVRAGMWGPLLKFLTQFPKAWEIDLAAATATSMNEAEESEESDEDEPDDLDDTDGSRKSNTLASTESKAFREFLLFLELGCYGSPVQGYPTIILVVSTLPPSILGIEAEAWSDFHTSFWAALDGRALTSLAPERAQGSAAFLSALLECTGFLARRSRVFSEQSITIHVQTARDAVWAVIKQQVSRVWDELTRDRLRVQPTVACKALVRTFNSLESLDKSLFEAAWESIAFAVNSTCSLPQSEPTSTASKRFTIQISLLHGLLKDVSEAQETTLSKSASDLVLTTAGVLVRQADEQVKGKNRLRPADAIPIQRLSEFVTHFSGLIFKNSELASRFDAMMRASVAAIISSESAVQLLIAFLSHRNDSIVCLSLWHDIIKAIASDVTLQEDALPALLSAAERGDIPDELRPESDEMDEVSTRLVLTVLDGASKEANEVLRTAVRRLLEKPSAFISSHTASRLVHRIAYTFSESSKALMRDLDSSRSIVPLRTPLTLLCSIIEARASVAFSDDVRPFLPDIFVFGYVLPRTELLSSEAKALCAQARQIWTTGISLEQGHLHEREALLTSVRSVLRELILDVNSRASPETVLQLVMENSVGGTTDLLGDFFPSQDAFEDMLHELPANPLDPTLAIVDPLVPPLSIWKEDALKQTLIKESHDQSGFYKYTRVVNCLLVVAGDNRDLVRANMWLLRHFLILSIAANEKSWVPSISSTYFSQDVALEALREITARVKALTAFLLSDVDDESWRTQIVQAHYRGDVQGIGDSAARSISFFVLQTLAWATSSDSFRDTGVLYVVMRHVLNGAVTSDAEQWMSLARHVEKQSPNTALAIIHAANKSALEPTGMDRYRNEIAAGVLGVRASRAGTAGLSLLHRLALAAPNPESDVVFLPQNRAVNFMKVCQGWLSSDEDIDEDVESEMTLIFQYLAPILQNVPGAHWDLVFDVAESSLENCSYSDDSSLIFLARTLKLVLIIQDLSSTNKSLRAIWSARELKVQTLVRDIVQSAPAGSSSVSTPRSVCWEMALTIVQNLPTSLIDHESLPKMAHLVLDPSPDVAKMAYSLLLQAARKRTEYFVIEAGVETSSETTKYELPEELLQVLHTALELSDSEQPNVFAYLLGWMVVFDLFDDASLRVKIGYAMQLRDLDLIGSSFLPFIFDLLEVYGRRSKPFPLEPWSVEEFFVQFYDADSRLSPRLMAAHLYYRALLNVPSLISTWWAGCKDRQLLTTVANLTIKYYSPVLIASELRHIKDPAGVAELSGENWNIKIAAGIGEVTAAYTVDEQDMAIAVRLPPDYPLHGIEVREVQKLGVEEKRWRGWLLAVQQIVTSQNGRIVDGLSIFKKNVTHHFENQTECAICYSIISVTELSLPKKRCRTCKNRFHAGCLFKWFNTSHTSSCPLCRSDFI